MKRERIGIIGAGNSAHALAAYLSNQGHQVTIYARRKEALGKMASTRRLNSRGVVNGSFLLHTVTTDLKKLTSESDVIFIATVTTAYQDVAAALAPYLTKRHYLVLFSGKLFGCLVFEQTLDAWGAVRVPVIETDALFACRLEGDSRVWIRGFKRWTLYACTHHWQTLEYGPLLRRFFPGLEPAENLLQRGLTDFGAHAHAVITVANLSRIDAAHPFLFYYEGLSPRTVVLLEQVEAEIKAVANAYGVAIIPMSELLNRYYGCRTDSLLDAIRSVPNYRHSLAPTSLSHRYLSEDVRCTLLPLGELADKASVNVPVLRSIVTLATTVCTDDLSKSSRSLKNLNMHMLTQEDIRSWLSESKVATA